MQYEMPTISPELQAQVLRYLKMKPGKREKLHEVERTLMQALTERITLSVLTSWPEAPCLSASSS